MSRDVYQPKPVTLELTGDEAIVLRRHLGQAIAGPEQPAVVGVLLAAILGKLEALAEQA